jgi:preprotein translocase subunit SecE
MNFNEIKEKIITYIKDVRAEGNKVVWPGRDYVVAATIVVFLIVFLVTVFIMLVDYGFAALYQILTGPAIH